MCVILVFRGPPETDVPAGGHATLATAHILFGLEGLIDSTANTITFNTQSGPLTAERLDNDSKLILQHYARLDLTCLQLIN